MQGDPRIKELAPSSSHMMWDVCKPQYFNNIFAIKNGLVALKPAADVFRVRFHKDMVHEKKQGRRGDELRQEDVEALKPALQITFPTVSDLLVAGPMSPDSFDPSALVKKKMQASWWGATLSWETAALEMENFGSIRITYEGERTVAMGKFFPIARFLRFKASGINMASTEVSALELKQKSSEVTVAAARAFFRNMEQKDVDALCAFCSDQALDPMLCKVSVGVGDSLYMPPGMIFVESFGHTGQCHVGLKVGSLHKQWSDYMPMFDDVAFFYAETEAQKDAKVVHLLTQVVVVA